MNVRTFQDRVSRTSARIMSLMLCDIFGQQDGESVRLGLPAGAVRLKDRNLIIAATVCDPPMFRDAIRQAANSTGIDVIVVHHGFYPETLNPVFVSALVHMSGQPHLFEKMVLYFHQADGYWLVPYEKGPFIALEEEGLRVDFEPPFLTIHQRAEGVCEAAKLIVRRTRNLGVL